MISENDLSVLTDEELEQEFLRALSQLGEDDTKAVSEVMGTCMLKYRSADLFISRQAKR